jgi:hypothetical protein
MKLHFFWKMALLVILETAAMGSLSAQGASLSFKGDALGMSLADFEAKHYAMVEGTRLPYFPQQTSVLRSLHTIAAKTIFPSEESEHVRVETIAGVNAQIVYFFQADTPADFAAIDADPRAPEAMRAYLVMVEATIDASDFSTVLDALTVKYGRPTHLTAPEVDTKTATPPPSARVAQWVMQPCEIDAIERSEHDSEKSEIRFSINGLLGIDNDLARRNSKDL